MKRVAIGWERHTQHGTGYARCAGTACRTCAGGDAVISGFADVSIFEGRHAA